MEKKQSVLSYILVALLSAVLTLIVAASCLVSFAGGYDNLMRGAKLTQILNVVHNEFVEEADLNAAADMAAEGMIQSLDDKWAWYMTADEYARRSLEMENNRRSIGVTITACDEGFLVADVGQDTPAYEAGILPGEKLVAINGEKMAGWAAEQIQEKVQLFGDESFTLTVLSQTGESRDLALSTRQEYTSPVVYERIDGTGYIILKNFHTGCSADAISAIEQLQEQGVESIVFDVRNNPGGYVHELTALLDYLLPEGEIFISRDREGNEETVHSDESFLELPMAVLMNAGSYSAAELFAAQLSEYGAAVTVGEHTTGKGRSQVSFILMDGSAVHISQEAYLTSQRKDLAEQGGIAPDAEILLSQEDAYLLYYRALPQEDDEQLQTALELLSKGS